jgi:hypothetical protein
MSTTTLADPGPSPSVRDAPHAVVIGSGFGGLAAAVRLGARGYRVTVLEKLDAPGGRAFVYKQDGFTFDAGPTVITAPFLLEELWALCGRRMSDDIDLRPVTPFYRIRFDDGTVFDYCGDPQAMREKVGRLAPGDVEGYDSFLRMSQEIYKVGFEDLGDVPFDSWTDMLKVVPDLMRMEAYLHLLPQHRVLQQLGHGRTAARDRLAGHPDDAGPEQQFPDAAHRDLPEGPPGPDRRRGQGELRDLPSGSVQAAVRSTAGQGPSGAGGRRRTRGGTRPGAGAGRTRGARQEEVTPVGGEATGRAPRRGWRPIDLSQYGAVPCRPYWIRPAVPRGRNAQPGQGASRP